MSTRKNKFWMIAGAFLALSLGVLSGSPASFEAKAEPDQTLQKKGLRLAAAPEVATLADLQTKLADEAVTEIVVTGVIALTTGTVIEGSGKTVRAVTTGLDASGVVHTGSSYKIFTVASGVTATINDLTIMGGSTQAVENKGTLYLNEVVVTRSGNANTEGGGFYNSGTAVLRNCAIYRNVAQYGGGLLNDGGKIIMDGCSLSENRSLDSAGGGGACENKNGGKMYINNSVISNNTSSEIGGAINNVTYAGSGNVSSLWMMNVTVTGNASTSSLNAGGGVGNNRSLLYAVNSIFTDNYYVSSTAAASSDIGWGGTNYMYNCLYGTFQKATLKDTSANNKTGDDAKNAFANYQTSGILTGTGTMSTVTYSHPVLTAVGERLYAPLKMETSAALTGGTKTYLDYSTPSSVKMGYGDTITGFGGLTAPDASAEVTSYLEGGTRAIGIMGASGASAISFYTVRLNAVSNGTVSGVSVYGDTYASGTLVTATATPDSGYYFNGWSNDGGTTIVSYKSEYSFRLTADLTLTPIFGTTQSTVSAFVNDWAALRASGDGSICGQLNSEAMTALLNRYNAAGDSDKALIAAAYDTTYNGIDCTIGESIAYVKAQREAAGSPVALSETISPESAFCFIGLAVAILSLSLYLIFRGRKRKAE